MKIEIKETEINTLEKQEEIITAEELEIIREDEVIHADKELKLVLSLI